MKVVITGGEGFLGWHTYARLRALTDHEVVRVGRASWPDLPAAVAQADAVIHLAGVNRGSDADVEQGNVTLARDLAAALQSAPARPTLVYAGSIHEGSSTPYGRGKAQAGEILRDSAQRLGLPLATVTLPNIFGEHARPRYNTFVATFIESVIAGHIPEVSDRPIALLHAQRAADCLITAASTGVDARPVGWSTSIADVWQRLTSMHDTYAATGDVPALTSEFDRDLFNSYRAGLFPDGYPIALTPHGDPRGRLVETVRSHGGQGQTFFSTTNPGMTRGDHFHLRKFERFVVISGRALIRLRRVGSTQVLTFPVEGDMPVVIDMPTMWVHNITNVGPGELTTMFWTDTLFDPQSPDTYWEPVVVPQ